MIIETHNISCLVGWFCKIHQLHFYREARNSPTNECPGYDSKQSDGEVPVMLELWGMQNNPYLPSLPGPLWPSEVALGRILSVGQIELKSVLNWITWNRTFLTLKLLTYAKLSCLNKAIFVCLTELFEIELFWHSNVCKQKLYSY